jgi:DNA mismatch repair protein PMS2
MREYAKYRKESEARPLYMSKHSTIDADMNIQMDERALMKMFQKEEFKELQVVGQFNKGFIMATLNVTDLFILDQHACDEKYNFEGFSRSTAIESQDLIK